MADVYRIGVAMTMTNGVSPILSVIARDLLHVHSRINEVQKGFSAWKAAIYGAGAAMAGTGMVRMMGVMVEHAGKLRHEQELLRIVFKDQAVGAKAVAEATKAAWETTRTVPTTKVEENVKAISDLHQVFGNIDVATRMMPKFQQMSALLAAVGRGDESNMAYLAARGMELRGALINPKTHQIDEERFAKEAEMMTNVVIGSRGRVGPRDFTNFIQQAGPAARLLSDEEMYRRMPAVIQAMGGFKAGTALNSLSAMTLGGQMTGRVAENWMKAGLMDQSKVHKGAFGNVKVDSGAFKDYDAKNPIQYVFDKVIPALEKMGAGKDAIEESLMQIFKLQNRQTAGRLLADIIQNRAQIEKDAVIYGGTMGSDEALKELLKKDPTMVMKAFHASWSNLLSALGDPAVGRATGFMTELTMAMRGMTRFALENPSAANAIVQTLGGVGLVLTAFGVLALSAAAISSSPILAAIIVIGAAFAVFANLNWDTISADFKRYGELVKSDFTKYWEILKAGASKLAEGFEWVSSVIGKGIDAIVGVLHRLGSAISGAFSFGGKGSGGAPAEPGATGGGAKPMNFVPPRSTASQQRLAVNMDGREVGSIVLDHIVRRAGDPSEGAVWQDSTRSSPSIDYSGSNWA
jgi:hypothetical protein